MKLKKSTIFLLILVYAGFYSGISFSDEIKAFTVKAVFMVKMTHFIEWPAPQPDSGKTPNFTICINHDHDIEESFSQWAQSGLIKNKPVVVKSIDNNLSQLASCNMLYITSNKKLSYLLEQAKQNNILTISDKPGNAQRGVLINFFNKNKKLRFEINLEAAKEAGFVFSPRILKLATIVSNTEAK